MKRTDLQDYTGWLPKWLKDILMLLRVGDCLIEYCNDCGVRQPISWWCADEALWLTINGSSSGALCPQCFDKRAARLGIYIRWHPEDVTPAVDAQEGTDAKG